DHDRREHHLVPARLAARKLDQALVRARLAAAQPLDVRIEELGARAAQDLVHLAPDDALERHAAALLEYLVGEDVAELAIHHGDGPGDVLGEVTKLALLVLERLDQLVVLLDVDEDDQHAQHVALRVAVGDHGAADVARLAAGPERLA